LKTTPRDIAAGALITLGTPLIAAPAWASAGNDDNVTFCHATASQSNPYVVITTDPKAFFQQGHDGHDGPVWTAAGSADQGRWGDIVPSFSYSYAQGQETVTGDYPGKNWTEEGQLVLQAGCQQPSPVTPTPSESATPSPSATSTGSPSPTPTATATDVPSESPSPDTTETSSPDPTQSAGPPSPIPSTPVSVAPTPPGGMDDGAPGQVPAAKPTATPTPSTAVLGSKVSRPPADPAAVPTASRLPHTGLPVWLLSAVGLVLVGMGAALLRRARPA
jgi:hypothetical protein